MTPMKKSIVMFGLIGWLALVFAAAVIGGMASVESGSFYRLLVRPGWAPPGWLFGPVWTVLYAMMGVAAWLVWRVRGFCASRTALFLFIVQLAVNALWTWLFFVWRQGGLAFFEIIVLGLLILFTIIAFWRIKSWAGILLIPYLAWVTFAAALTLAVWRLNPTLL